MGHQLMNIEQVKLRDLCYLNDEQLMQIILSSGDYFPGFYRFTLGTQFIGEETLNLSTLVWLYLYQQSTGTTFHKEDWLELQHEIHDRDIASDQARNAGNFPHVRDLFEQKMMDWYFNAKGLDIIYMDTESKSDEIKEGQTYYFMGSLINFENSCLRVGHNDLSRESLLELRVSADVFYNYVNATFSKQQISDLFLESEIVAHLSFDETEQGHIEMQEEHIDKFMLKNTQGKLLAAPVESRDIPMRFAKTIRLTNFRREDNGTFHPWRTNQNW